MRLPAPPDAAGTAAELAEVRALAPQRDAARDAIRFWDAGAPNYRWNELALSKLPAAPGTNGPPGAQAFRGMALLNVAIYDATVAAWDTKYAYNRPRPGAARPVAHDRGAHAGVPVLPVGARRRGRRGRHRADVPPAGRRRRCSPRRRRRPRARACWPGCSTRATSGPAWSSAGRSRPGWSSARRPTARTRSGPARCPTGPGTWVGTTPVEPLAGTWQTWALAAGEPVPPRPAAGRRTRPSWPPTSTS